MTTGMAKWTRGGWRLVLLAALAAGLEGVAAPEEREAVGYQPRQGAGVAEAAEIDRLSRANAALEKLIEALDSDRPFLMLDRGRGRLTLRHGEALLRDCRVVSDSLGLRPSAKQSLSRHIRRYRRGGPYTEPTPGPFDWEQYLAAAATPDGAMYFDGGLLVYASEAWGAPRAPSLRVSVGDLRALSDALPTGAALVVMPADWRNPFGQPAPEMNE